VYRLVRSYLKSSSMKRAALKALSKTLTEDELSYLRAQFMLLEPNKSGRVSFENFKVVGLLLPSHFGSLDLLSVNM
jgi:Ca2+-binding EF-hand superfamily protein